MPTGVNAAGLPGVTHGGLHRSSTHPGGLMGWPQMATGLEGVEVAAGVAIMVAKPPTHGREQMAGGQPDGIVGRLQAAAR